MTEINIDTASAEELRAYGLEQGVKFDKRHSVDTMRARLHELVGTTPAPAQDASEADDDPFAEEAPPAAAPAKAAAAKTALSGEAAERARNEAAFKKLVTVTIHRTDKPGGNQPVPIGVNGRNILVRRGTPVEMPLPFFLALKNAQQLIYTLHDDGKGDFSMEAETVPAYPFSVGGNVL